LNIPVGNVNVDLDYDSFILPTYEIPSGFLRHIKKIGDEADPAIDYVVEDEDLVEN
jgi:hypothetical protein